jgi:hypothetical protein
VLENETSAMLLIAELAKAEERGETPSAGAEDE